MFIKCNIFNHVEKNFYDLKTPNLVFTSKILMILTL
jgi:hypothetical protein